MGVPKEPIIEGIREFVAPSSSSLVRMPVDDIIDIYRHLSDER